MASIAEQYGRELKGELNYWPAWLPGTIVRLGDCGTIDNFQFNRRTSLKALGVDYETQDQGSPGDLIHQSAKGIDIAIQAKGESKGIPGLPQGAVGVGFTFSREGTVVFATRDTSATAIADIDKLGRDVKEKRKLFPASYVVVTEIVAAGSATVLVSRRSSGGFTLEARADVPVAGLSDLAKVDANFTITRNEGLATQIVADQNLTPLFRIYGFRRNWFSGYPTDEFESLGPEGDLADAPFEEGVFDDYADAHAEEE